MECGDSSPLSRRPDKAAWRGGIAFLRRTPCNEDAEESGDESPHSKEGSFHGFAPPWHNSRLDFFPARVTMIGDTRVPEEPCGNAGI
jgi:hypothetical protein